MKKLLLNIYLLILLSSLPYNAYSQVYIPNSNTWNKYVNNALVNDAETASKDLVVQAHSLQEAMSFFKF